MSERASPEAYLREVFALDPRGDEERVLALRRAYLEASAHPSREGVRLAREGRGVAAVSDPASDESVSSRDRAERSLAELRESFWELEPAAIEARSSALQLDELPDLARYRDRLLRVAGHRAAFDALSTDLAVSEELFDAFRAVVVATGRRAAELRAAYVRESVVKNRTRADKRGVAVLKKRFPELWALEEAWFQRIRSAKRDRKDSRKIRFQIGCFGIWFLVVVGRILLRWMRDAGWFQ